MRSLRNKFLIVTLLIIGLANVFCAHANDGRKERLPDGYLQIIGNHVDESPNKAGIFSAIGDAVAVIGGQNSELRAEAITYNTSAKTLTASGHVKLLRNGNVTEAPFLEFAVNSEEYLITKPGTHAVGPDMIAREGNDKVYELRSMLPRKMFESEGIYIAEFLGWESGLRGHFRVRDRLKGPPYSRSGLPIKFTENTPDYADKKYPNDSSIPMKQSLWILFIPSCVPKDGTYETYEGAAGRLEYNSKNIHRVMQGLRLEAPLRE